MEGDCLSCIKYLMFIFNFLIFVSICCFLTLPLEWSQYCDCPSLLSPSPQFFMLVLEWSQYCDCPSLLSPSPQFFMLILLIFLAELATAILAFIFREHVSKFTRELKRHYQGHNNTDVFTSTWNAIMTTVRLPSGATAPETVHSRQAPRLQRQSTPVRSHGSRDSPLPSGATAPETVHSRQGPRLQRQSTPVRGHGSRDSPLPSGATAPETVHSRQGTSL
uniref:Uncharacterized protein n=1 Tax=Hucho hucho TaxID=62062 RepID=A0A4W5KX70_9TELE